MVAFFPNQEGTAGRSLFLGLLVESAIFAFSPDHEETAGRSLSVNFTKCLFVPFAGGAWYVMAHAHVTYAANRWMKELTKLMKMRQPVPQWMLSVVAHIMKPDTDLDTRERLSRDANAVQWSVDEESFVGICRRLLIE